MIELFFVLPLKGQFYKRMYTFTTCCSGPLYGPADCHIILKIRETIFTSRALVQIKTNIPSHNLTLFRGAVRLRTFKLC
jgi:hypothetical protein